MNENPFAPPESTLDGSASGVGSLGRDAAKTARQLRRTSSWLLFFGVWGLLFAAGEVATGRYVTGLFGLGAGVLDLVGGAALWRWHPRARPMALAGLLPLAPVFPVGTWVAVRGTLTLFEGDTRGLLSLAPSARARFLEPVNLSPRHPAVPLASPAVILAVVGAVAYLASRHSG